MHTRIILLILVATACSPMVPLYQENVVQPNPLATVQTDAVTIHLQHLQNQYGHYVFDLEIINDSDNEILFNPNAVSYYASPKLFPVPDAAQDVHAQSYTHSQLIYKRKFARKPEHVKAIFQEREKMLATLQTISLVISATAIVYDAVQDTKDFKKENFTSKDASRASNRDALVASTLVLQDGLYEANTSAREENFYLPYEIFPETTIEAGGGQRGKLFLPYDTSYRYTRIIIPIGYTDYVFDFKRKSAQGRE